MARRPSSWRECRVEDLAADKRNAIVGGPFGSNLVSRDYTPIGVPVIRGQNLSWGGREVGGEFVYVSDDKADSLSANLAIAGDIVFTQRGNAVLNGGQVAIVPTDGYPRYVVSQSQMKMSPNPELADTLFLYYIFKSQDHELYLRNNAIVTGVPHTNLAILREYSFRLPSLLEQQRITAVLKTLDDKIELNRRMNSTLESMAGALFKSWFVDFDPVIDKALAAGNPIPEPLLARAETRRATATKGTPALPAHIQKLFPDAFHFDEQMGWIPEGWNVQTIGETLELSYGKSLPAKKRIEGDVPVYGSGGISGWHNESLCEGPGLVVGRKGTVGSLYWVTEDYFPIDTVFFVVNKSKAPLYWIYQSLQLLDIKSMGADSAVPGVNRNAIYGRYFCLPDSETWKVYWENLKPMADKMKELDLASQSLAKLRDTLLPQLLSGELRIPDAEQLVTGSL